MISWPRPSPTSSAVTASGSTPWPPATSGPATRTSPRAVRASTRQPSGPPRGPRHRQRRAVPVLGPRRPDHRPDPDRRRRRHHRELWEMDPELIPPTAVESIRRIWDRGSVLSGSVADRTSTSGVGERGCSVGRGRPGEGHPETTGPGTCDSVHVRRQPGVVRTVCSATRSDP